MMRNFLLFLILSQSSVSFAQDALEEALIINQELSFLQESTRQMPVNQLEGAQVTPAVSQSRDDNLEILYFGENQDTINTRKAAPVRPAQRRQRR
jgi:hypothetical protein